MDLSALVLVLAAVSACSSADREERRWTEDVRLEDGTIVPIERYVAFDETNALGGGAYNAVETKATLKFRGELASLPPWDFPRMALALYRGKETGNWVLVSTTSSCEVWYEGGEPRPPYWQHELINGMWREVSLSPESIGKKPNLFRRYRKEDFSEHVTPEMTASRQSDVGADWYRHVAQDAQDFHCMGYRARPTRPTVNR